MTWNSSEESTVVQICMLSKQEAVTDLREEQNTEVQISEERLHFIKLTPHLAMLVFTWKVPVSAKQGVVGKQGFYFMSLENTHTVFFSVVGDFFFFFGKFRIVFTGIRRLPGEAKGLLLQALSGWVEEAQASVGVESNQEGRCAASLPAL